LADAVKLRSDEGSQRCYRKEVWFAADYQDGVTVAKEIELKDTLENMAHRW